MKKLLLSISLLACITSFSQKISKEEQKKIDAVKQEMYETIPTKDNKIFYDAVITVDSSLKRDILFTRIRQWFVEKFTDSKSVLEVNDIDNGLLTGKGTYKYVIVNGLNVHDGYVHFILNVAVKDGKFRYQVYSFTTDELNSSMLGGQSFPNKIDMNDVYTLKQKGQRNSYCKKYLGQVVDLMYLVNTTLPETINNKNITEF
jgi:hypothetical protein